jgi:23S rRNA (adenine2030-N6)-methyltransferase
MLSYQHQYHAGNLADVHKHALLAVMLDYLTAKDKPLTYIETHAGRGLYDLGSEAARKTGEAEAGVLAVEGRFAADHPYRQRLAEVRAMQGDGAYPGSPLIAALSLREGDVMHLAELHPQEHAALVTAAAPWGAHVHRRDGFEMALALTPPTPRRGMMLIDPSWEVKADYDHLPQIMARVHAKWNVGVLALWYPVLAGAPHAPMLARLAAQFPGALCHEVRFPPARSGHRMVGSGMFVVNPPWGLDGQAAEISTVFAGG